MPFFCFFKGNLILQILRFSAPGITATFPLHLHYAAQCTQPSSGGEVCDGGAAGVHRRGAGAGSEEGADNRDGGTSDARASTGCAGRAEAPAHFVQDLTCCLDHITDKPAAIGTAVVDQQVLITAV